MMADDDLPINQTQLNTDGTHDYLGGSGNNLDKGYSPSDGSDTRARLAAVQRGIDAATPGLRGSVKQMQDQAKAAADSARNNYNNSKMSAKRGR